MDDDFIASVQQISDNQLYILYAEKGYWYDLIEHLYKLIQTEIDNKSLLTHQSHFLKQVKLPIVAGFVLIK